MARSRGAGAAASSQLDRPIDDILDTADLVSSNKVDADVVTDGPITTGRALGAAIPFALELVRLLTDEQTAARTAEEIVYRV